MTDKLCKLSSMEEAIRLLTCGKSLAVCNQRVAGAPEKESMQNRLDCACVPFPEECSLFVQSCDVEIAWAASGSDFRRLDVQQTCAL